jgi:hypothetical protein
MFAAGCCGVVPRPSGMQGINVADIDPLNQRVRAKARSRREAARESLFLSATIRRVGGLDLGFVPVRVRNLSPVGLMADHDALTRPGDRVIVEMRGLGFVSGEVAWVRRGRIGVRFDEEINPQRATSWLKPEPQPAPKSFKPAR